eukprot:4801241-Pyramimonas_sp.AAC.1
MARARRHTERYDFAWCDYAKDPTPRHAHYRYATSVALRSRVFAPHCPERCYAHGGRIKYRHAGQA